MAGHEDEENAELANQVGLSFYMRLYSHLVPSHANLHQGAQTMDQGHIEKCADFFDQQLQIHHGQQRKLKLADWWAALYSK